MNEEQIAARAACLVAERHRERAGKQFGRWEGLLLALVAIVIAGFFLYPLPLPQKLLLAIGGVCGLRPAHSYFADGIQLPLEARMTGIYGGFALTLGWLLAAKRLGVVRLAGGTTVVLLGGMFLSMVLDGVNSTLAEVGLPHPYISTNITRITTGLLAGVAIAAVLAWLIAALGRPRVTWGSQCLLSSPSALLWPLALATLFGVVVSSEQSWIYYPVVALSVGGLILALSGSLLLPLLLISGLCGQLTAPRQLLAPAAGAMLITFAILAGTAALRWNFGGLFV
jgi:uncharacterized membrane protein